MDASICPLCGEPNGCAIVEGKSECWCFTATVPEAVVARVPDDDRNRRCICQRCAASVPTAADRTNEQADLPIACALTPDDLRSRREGLLADLLRQADGQERLPEGIRLRFAASAEVLALIARAVEAERQCCRFLRFGIVVEPAGGPMFLEVSGGPGTGDFLDALVQL